MKVSWFQKLHILKTVSRHDLQVYMQNNYVMVADKIYRIVGWDFF